MTCLDKERRCSQDLTRFMPADALWTLAMACNVYLTFFRRYDQGDLRALEWKYALACYGIPFFPAITYLFIKTEHGVRMYGPAVVSMSEISSSATPY